MKTKAEDRYRQALELYRSSTLSITEICRQTDTPVDAFRSYIRRAHRELMFARHGISVPPEKVSTTKLRGIKGMTAAALAKYGDAICACDDIAYIEYNVSQIARMFHLDPTALGQQLRVHFPEIIERREKRRIMLGKNDNLHRGAKRECRERYAVAVEHLRTTDDTIEQTARLYNLSYPGLREHLLCYHKDIVIKRWNKRTKAKSTKIKGALTGKGTRHVASPAQDEKYGEALRLYRSSAMTQKEISEATGVSLNGLRNYLRMWHPELILERRGVKCAKGEKIKISDTKAYLKSAAVKYADAIERLKTKKQSMSEVAREYNLNPETFRSYLHEHEPELAADLGMTRLSNGTRASTRCINKYSEAVNLYMTTGEPLVYIARRLGLVYNSLFSYIRRHYPEAGRPHNKPE